MADFSDAALVLLGHGSTLNAGSGDSVRQHAGELRRRGCFREVREAFWKQEPQVMAVLAQLTAPLIFIVPLFVSEGYFTEELIPRALGFRGPDEGPWSRVREYAGQRLVFCRPVGTHASMTRVLLARARDIVRQFPFPRAPQPSATTLFIAGHGTAANADSRVPIERQAELIRVLGQFAAVHAVYLEEAPRISECYQLAQTKNFIVVPFFISDGLHVREDIPLLLGEPERILRQRLRDGQPTWRNPTERRDKLVWYTRSVGSDPLLADVILERVREAAPGGGQLAP